MTPYNDGKSGYLAQSNIPLYFGLGDAVAVDSIEIKWPSGKVETLAKDLSPNRLMTIEERRN